MQQFGIKGISTAGIYNAPIFQITGVTSIDLDAADDSYQNNPASGFEWIDNVSWTRGRHFMKFGIDMNRERINGNRISSNIYGAYNFQRHLYRTGLRRFSARHPANHDSRPRESRAGPPGNFVGFLCAGPVQSKQESHVELRHPVGTRGTVSQQTGHALQLRSGLRIAGRR